MKYVPDEALEAAMQLFWSHGYEATSLQDLLRAMGLSKSSLYQGFGGKKELFMQCIDLYCRTRSEKMQSLLQKEGSGYELIERLLLNSATEDGRNEMRRGCLLMNTATELAHKDPDIAIRVGSAFEGFRSLLKGAILRGQREGDITSEQDAEVLAKYLLTCIGGLKAVVKSGMETDQAQHVVGVMLRALK